MRTPIVGLLASVSAALGLYGLFWYHKLGKTAQEEADRLAAEFATKCYNKALHELESHQMCAIHGMVKSRVAV